MKNEKFNLTTPVLYLVFNRLDTVKKTFPEIKKAKPKQLFISADGPRNSEEKKKTDAVRKYILDNLDWECDVKKLFRDKNLGCKYAVSSAIDWFFKNVKQGIILEDDCLPSQSFFRFCQEMLERYKDDERIMHISGTNIEGKSKINESYFFSETFNVWGWATWRRAWDKYNIKIKDWPKWRIKILKFMRGYSFIDKIKSLRLYELTYRGKLDTWDYQWGFICLKNHGFSIIPSKNLATNLGFNEGTHTTNYKEDEKTLRKMRLIFPLKYNNIIMANSNYLKNYSSFFRANIFEKLFSHLGMNK